MFKVTITYPYSSTARFDHVYYREVHVASLRSRLGAVIRGFTVEKGVVGVQNVEPTFIACCCLLCDSIEAFHSAMSPHLAELLADISNYTDLAPTLSFSEIAAVGAGDGS